MDKGQNTSSLENERSATQMFDKSIVHSQRNTADVSKIDISTLSII